MIGMLRALRDWIGGTDENALGLETRYDVSTHFEIFADDRGFWYWNLISANGNAVAQSARGYANRREARRAAHAVPRISALAVTIEPLEIEQHAHA